MGGGGCDSGLCPLTVRLARGHRTTAAGDFPVRRARAETAGLKGGGSRFIVPAVDSFWSGVVLALYSGALDCLLRQNGFDARQLLEDALAANTVVALRPVPMV